MKTADIAATREQVASINKDNGLALIWYDANTTPDANDLHEVVNASLYYSIVDKYKLGLSRFVVEQSVASELIHMIRAYGHWKITTDRAFVDGGDLCYFLVFYQVLGVMEFVYEEDRSKDKDIVIKNIQQLQESIGKKRLEHPGHELVALRRANGKTKAADELEQAIMLGNHHMVYELNPAVLKTYIDVEKACANPPRGRAMAEVERLLAEGAANK